MRGETMIKILDTLFEASGDAVLGFEAFLRAGYGASSGKMMYEFDRLKTARDIRRAAQIRYHSVLYKLKRDGLIKENTTTGRKKLIITAKGKQRLSFLRSRRKDLLPPRRYSAKKSDVFTILAFDIPETKRKKRDWLRKALLQLGFAMIQKSVWIGKIALPEEFLSDLSENHIMEYVQIFQITRTGTLEHITDD